MTLRKSEITDKLKSGEWSPILISLENERSGISVRKLYKFINRDFYYIGNVRTKPMTLQKTTLMIIPNLTEEEFALLTLKGAQKITVIDADVIISACDSALHVTKKAMDALDEFVGK